MQKIRSIPFHSFRDRVTAPLVGKVRSATSSLVRVGFGCDGGDLPIEIERQDAFYVIFQLQDHPPHEHWVGTRSRPAPASPRGSVHIADLSTEHSALLDRPFDSLNMILPRVFLDELSVDTGMGRVSHLAVPDPWTTEDRVLTRLESALIGALSAPASCSQLFVDHLLTATALHIIERYGSVRRAVVRPGGLAPWQERRARELIAANLDKSLSLADIASECRLSVAHFSRAFKTSVGVTPHGWLQTCRIDKSKELLKRGDTSFAEIALQCGFADQSHFNRTFKRVAGTTPGSWRSEFTQ